MNEQVAGANQTAKTSPKLPRIIGRAVDKFFLRREPRHETPLPLSNKEIDLLKNFNSAKIVISGGRITEINFEGQLGIDTSSTAKAIIESGILKNKTMPFSESTRGPHGLVIATISLDAEKVLATLLTEEDMVTLSDSRPEVVAKVKALKAFLEFPVL